MWKNHASKHYIYIKNNNICSKVVKYVQDVVQNMLKIDLLNFRILFKFPINRL